MSTKLSFAMMETLCTAGRRGVYRVYGKKQTLKALERRGYVTMTSDSDRSATITTAGLEISAEARKTAIIA